MAAMKDNSRRNISESFEDIRNVIILGLLSYIYFALHFSPEEIIKRVLPPMDPIYYGLMAVFVLATQIVVWKFFRHFQGKWFKHPVVYLLFICEYGILLFMAGLVAWPIYLLLAGKL